MGYDSQSHAMNNPSNPLVAIGISLFQMVFFFLCAVALERFKYRVKDGNSPPPMIGAPTQTVQREMEMMEKDRGSNLINVFRLSKNYGGDSWAVFGSSFGVKPDSVFGLLGPNGAGKSTTFNILTSQISKTSGLVEMKGQNMAKTDLKQMYREVGLCSQKNIFWEDLTVYEHLVLIGGMKGLPIEKRHYVATFLMNIMSLNEYKNKKAEVLSGGNKRKLCVCIAILSNPEILFLDEPSSGVDAVSRRSLWDTIKLTKSHNKSSVILTTHTLVEAESLCDKIGIMINGTFQVSLFWRFETPRLVWKETVHWNPGRTQELVWRRLHGDFEEKEAVWEGFY